MLADANAKIVQEQEAKRLAEENTRIAEEEAKFAAEAELAANTKSIPDLPPLDD